MEPSVLIFFPANFNIIIAITMYGDVNLKTSGAWDS